MSTHHRSHVTAATLSLLLAGAVVACGGSHAESKPPVAASAPPGGASEGGPSAAASSGGQNAHPSGAGGAAGAPRGSGGATSPSGSEQDEQDDAELVVSRDVVARCPKLRAVRQHVAEFDPDMVWLAVLESLGECMGQGGPWPSKPSASRETRSIGMWCEKCLGREASPPPASSPHQ